jgi:hypothetical protein
MEEDVFVVDPVVEINPVINPVVVVDPVINPVVVEDPVINPVVVEDPVVVVDPVVKDPVVAPKTKKGKKPVNVPVSEPHEIVPVPEPQEIVPDPVPVAETKKKNKKPVVEKPVV